MSLPQMSREREMSFEDIGKELGLTGVRVGQLYHRALGKLRVHMKTEEDWAEALTAGMEIERVPALVVAALEYGAFLDKLKLAPQPRHEETAARRAFRRAYARFVSGS